MKLGVPDESAIEGLTGGGFITNTLRWLASAISAGFNLEHDTETSRHSTIRATGTIAERGRTVAMGDWIAVPYGSLSFAANASAWTVQAADVVELKYTLLGHTLIYNFYFTATSVGAGSGALLLPLPPGFKSAMNVDAPFEYIDNGTTGMGTAQTSPGATIINLFTATTANWAASTNATRVSGQLIIEIQ
jgi:hypothetical protein